MPEIVLILEVINAVVAIIVNGQRVELPGLPLGYSNYVFTGLFFIGFLAIYVNSERMKRDIRDKVYEQVKKDIEVLKPIEPLKGSLDSISSADRWFIVSLSIEMGLRHVHGGDLQGLLADRASGIPLNELMARNCSVCGVPRNKQSKRWGV
jgi:hypothetical protein